jgi:CheY-like chemotaxis protein
VTDPDLTDPDLTGRRILVVEDEHMVARSIVRLLKLCGVRVIGAAAPVEDALALLADNERVDAALLDVNLRGISAHPVADALIARGVPFVFTTGYEMSVIPERYRDAAVVQKPFDPIEISKALLPLVR